MYFLFIFAIGLLAILAWDFLNKWHRYVMLRKSKIAGAPALPLLGNALQMRGLNSENVIPFLHENTRNKQKVFRLWVLHQLTVYTADAKDYAALLSSPTQITKNNVYDMLSQWLGDGLLMSTGKKWHTRRKIITPTFHFKILEQFVEIFNQQSNVLVEKLAKEANGQNVVNIFPVVCLMALDVIAETAMGVKVNAQKNSEFGYVKAVKIVTELIALRLRRPLWRVDWMFRILAPKEHKMLLENIDLMQKFTKNVIQERRLKLQAALSSNVNAIPEEDEDSGTKRRQALLDVLLQSTIEGKPLSDEDIREEVETFMFEGHDTTTSAIAFALYLISRHPNVQDQLYAEIVELLGNGQGENKRSATLQELQSLKYMECVIKEALRLYPSVPVIGRYIGEDYVLNGKVIPRNTQLNVPIFLVMRDSDYFPNPHSFCPERFMGEKAKEIDPYAFVPFSAGPRNCIGQKFAMLEMKCTISKLLQNYELLPLGPDVELSLSLILRSVTGVNIGLKPRKI